MAGMSGWYYFLLGGLTRDRLGYLSQGAPVVDPPRQHWSMSRKRVLTSTLPWKRCRLAPLMPSGPGSALLGPHSLASDSLGRVHRRFGWD
jgi:hypothetical protein